MSIIIESSLNSFSIPTPPPLPPHTHLATLHNCYSTVEVSKNSTYSIEEYGAAYTWQEFLFTTKPGAGGIGGLVCISGWALLAIFSIIILGALRCVRKRYFEVCIKTSEMSMSCVLLAPIWTWNKSVILFCRCFTTRIC